MITDMTRADLPTHIVADIRKAHDEQKDHAFDCDERFTDFFLEVANEGNDAKTAIRHAAVRHSRHIRWIRDNVGTD